MCLISFLCVLCREAWGVFICYRLPVKVCKRPRFALLNVAFYHVKGRVSDCNMGHITDCHTAGQGV